MTRLDAIVRRIAVSLSIAGAWSATLLAVWAQEAVPPQWVGEYQKPGTGVQATQEKDQTAKLLVYGGGLPGAGWDRQAVRQVELEIDEVERFLKDLAVEKVVRSSPTLGAQPPIGAKVLFDGSQASLKEQWEAGAKVDADGRLVAGATTRERFGDYRLHLEFQIPWMPDASGQGRGNSGVYHQGRYETQVLDSFGMENLPDGCGAIYAVKPAQFNASLPPGTWQTYDIEFQAARWDAQGKKISDARLTVDLNGQRVHTAEPVPGSTRAAPLGEDANAGPIHLQDHGNPVKYRNIWVVPFDSRKEELRPRVAGYERFPEGWDTQGDPHAAGRLLVGELGCVRCHSPGALEPSLFPKEAPRLDLVSSRLKAPWVEAYLKDPASVHPGATMPDLLNGKDAGDRATIAKELTAYLFESSRPMRGALADSNASARGKQLYETTGCLVCHGEQQEAGSSRGLVPLPVIADKYRVEGLVSFLLNPHQTRPSGRMPSMRLSEQEARDVALYLIPQGQESQLQPNVRFEAFEGSWERLPDFSKLKAYRQGTTAGFDLREAQRTNQFAMRFEGYLELASDGEYQFTIGSDDGSRLKIDGESIVDVDGVHPHQTRAGSRRLAAGIHRVEVEYFQGGGEWTLQLDWGGPGVERQPLAESLRVDQKPVAKPVEDVEATKRLAAKGKQWFGSLGCIQCHALDRANEEPAKVQANLVPLDRASVDRGCLAATPAPGVPNYRLTQRQRESIAGALRENGVPTNGTDRSTIR
jgi:mono/diheme cytochrome c family protein